MKFGRGGIDDEVKKSFHVSFYNDPPLQEINIDYFEEVCKRRLRLLRGIESKAEELGYQLSHKIISTLQNKEEINLYINNPIKLELEVVQADIISHFLLRLSFSRTKEK